MGETVLTNPSVLQDAIRSIFAALDRPAYWLLGLVYQLFFNVASANIFSGESIMRFYGRVQLIIGVFMMFQLAMTFLRGIVNPDSIMDSKSGGANIIIRIFTALLLLIAITPIRIDSPQNEFEKQLNNNGLMFGVLYSLQYRLLKNNTLGKLILGTESSSSNYLSGDSDDEESLQTASRMLSSTVLKAFYRINLKPEDERTKHDDSVDDAAFNENRMCEDISDEAIEEYKKMDADTGKILDYVNESCKVSGEKRYAFTQMPIISTIVGFVFVFILLSFSVDVAIRSIKLAILRLLAPIPIISYMDPKGSKDTAFGAWVKLLTSTYLDLFIRLGLVYLILYMVRDMISNGIVINNAHSALGHISLILIFIALFFFAKEAPKFIRQAMGLKDDGGKLFGGLGQLKQALGFAGGVGAAAFGMIGSARANYKAAQEENAELHPNSNNTVRNVGSAIAGAISGGAVGVKALMGKDPSARSVIQAQNQRNAQRAAHSTLPGRLMNSASGIFTGKTLADVESSKLEKEKNAFNSLKNWKNSVKEEAAKNGGAFDYQLSDGTKLEKITYDQIKAMKEAGADDDGNYTFNYKDENGVLQHKKIDAKLLGDNTMDAIADRQVEVWQSGTVRDGKSSYADVVTGNGKLSVEHEKVIKAIDDAKIDVGGDTGAKLADDYGKLGKAMGAAGRAQYDRENSMAYKVRVSSGEKKQ